VGLFTANPVARVAAIVLLALHALAQIAAIGAYPVWSVLMIVLDVLVLFALTARWPEVRTELTAPPPGGIHRANGRGPAEGAALAASVRRVPDFERTEPEARRGPVDCVVVTFPEHDMDERFLSQLHRLAADGAIRILDFLLVRRGTDDTVRLLEIGDLPLAQAQALGVVDGAGRAGGGPLAAEGLFNARDGRLVADGLSPGTAASLLAIEHRWQIGLRDVAGDVGARIAGTYRVPPEVVEEAYEARNDVAGNDIARNDIARDDDARDDDNDARDSAPNR
jgi:hypothetical protein